MSTIKFRIAARSHEAGRPNTKNEDSLLVNDNLTTGQWSDSGNKDVQLFDTDKEILLGDKGALLVVCDGMGGMNAGEVASSLAVETVQQWFSHKKLTDDVIASPESIMRHIEKTIIAADTDIKKDSVANKEHEGMGSTIVIAWIIGKHVYVGWCGDSRAYRFNPADGLMQLSHDHSYVQELVDAGKLSEELAFDHPNNNIITRSLGDPKKTAKPDVKQYALRDNDIILLCSDGLCGVLRDNEIANVIRQNTGSMGVCRDALWEAARNAGWYDNCTTDLCQILSGSETIAPVQQIQTHQSSQAQGQPAQPSIQQPVSPSEKSAKKLIRNLYIIIVALVLALGASFLHNSGYLNKILGWGKNLVKGHKNKSELEYIFKAINQIDSTLCTFPVDSLLKYEEDIRKLNDSIVKSFENEKDKLFQVWDSIKNKHKESLKGDSILLLEIDKRFEQIGDIGKSRFDSVKIGNDFNYLKSIGVTIESIKEAIKSVEEKIEKTNPPKTGESSHTASQKTPPVLIDASTNKLTPIFDNVQTQPY